MVQEGAPLAHAGLPLPAQTLFTLAKEKLNDSARMAVATVIVDFLLILAIFINLEYPWAVDPKNP